MSPVSTGHSIQYNHFTHFFNFKVDERNLQPCLDDMCISVCLSVCLSASAVLDFQALECRHIYISYLPAAPVGVVAIDPGFLPSKLAR